MFGKLNTKESRAESQKNIRTTLEAQKQSLIILLQINTASAVRVWMHMETIPPTSQIGQTFCNCGDSKIMLKLHKISCPCGKA